MNLVEAYFEKTGSNVNKLSIKIGCSPSTLYRMLEGSRPANPEMALKVEFATNGEIRALYFMDACIEAVRALQPTESAA